MTYWLDIFTDKSWKEFVAAGASTSGFPERRWKTVQMIRRGDILLCYVSGLSRWFAALEVVSDAALWDDTNLIWTDGVYPCRVKVHPMVVVEPADGIPARDTVGRLRLFADLQEPSKWWSGPLRTSPRVISKEDGDLIVGELRELHRAQSGPGGTPPPPGGEDESRHEGIKRKVAELGSILGRHTEEEYRAAPYVYDVIWKETEGLPRPSHVFEVQDRGAVNGALAKLQHARDMWRPKLFLIVTGERDRRKVDALLRPFLQGTFHGIARHTTVLTGEVIDEIHRAFSSHRETIAQFLED